MRHRPRVRGVGVGRDRFAPGPGTGASTPRRWTPTPWALLLLLTGAFAVPAAGQPDDPAAPPEPPCAAIAARLRLGSVLRLGPLTLVQLRLAADAQPGLDAHVGLHGQAVELLELPGPAGRWHVRVANRGAAALELPTGTALLTPLGPSRLTDRPVWIAPGTATFVPVVQATEAPPPGPYASRGRGLTPFEMLALREGTWAARVRSRNQVAGVDPSRLDDAGEAYVTPWFESRLAPDRESLERLGAVPDVVGVAVVDERGPVFAHVETDTARFRALWPRLLEGIVIDAAMEDLEGRRAQAGADVRETLRDLFGALAQAPMERTTFGRGTEVRWMLEGGEGRWEGLLLPEGPACLTLLRWPPRPQGPAPGPTPPTGPGGSDAPTGDPGVFEGARRVRPTPFEERFRERRDGLGGGVDRGSPSAPPAGGGNGGGGFGGGAGRGGDGFR